MGGGTFEAKRCVWVSPSIRPTLHSDEHTALSSKVFSLSLSGHLLRGTIELCAQDHIIDIAYKDGNDDVLVVDTLHPITAPTFTGED